MPSSNGRSGASRAIYERIRDLVAQGKGCAEIAAAVGRAPSTVAKYIADARIELGLPRPKQARNITYAKKLSGGD